MPTTIDFTWLFIKMMAVLVVTCLAAALVLKYAVPRWSFFRRAVQRGTINILHRTALDSRKYVWVIQVGTRYFLLGAAEGSVTCLAELSADDIVPDRANTNDRIPNSKS